MICAGVVGVKSQLIIFAAPSKRLSSRINEETVMTSFKIALASAALMLCFGTGSAMAQAAAPAPAPATTTTKTPDDNNGASATVVAKCEADADKQGLKGDAKGTFLVDCEKKAGKQ